MSQENVEIVRRAYDALNRGDADAFVELHDAEGDFFPRIRAIEGGGSYHGHAGLRAYWRDMRAAFIEWTGKIEEVRNVGETVIVKVNVRTRGRDSGAALDFPMWQPIKFRSGRMTWWAVYTSESEALEAASLSE
jgi:ketosteroid isomerase-like protein